MKESAYLTNDYLINRNARGNQFSGNALRSPRAALRFFLTLALLLMAGVGAKAAKYVFVYNNNNYLSVNDNGQVANSNTLTAGCVWTCVSNTTSLDEASLDNNNSRFLFTIVNGTKYWMVGSTTNGDAITVTTTDPGTAYWRNDGTRLHYYNSNAYYVYYRGSSWRTSRSASTSNGDTYYARIYTGGTIRNEYRSTTTAGTIQNETTSGTEYELSAPAITPSLATLNSGENQTFSLTTTSTLTTITVTIPAHAVFNTNQHYYNGILTTNAADFAVRTTGTPTTEGVSYNWVLSGDGSSNLSMTGTGNSRTVTHSTATTSDATATLTVTASATGATNQTATSTITLWAPTQQPTITRSGNSVSLATNSVGATIYYTTDGSTPSASNGTAYTTPINLEILTLPVTVKAIAVRGGNSSGTAEQEYSTLSCAAPVISISSTGAVTISCATEGASIRYTTDETDPTSTSGDVYGGSFNVSNLTTVKAIAYKNGYTDSEVASEQYITSGVSGSTVVLDDREDHNWTYYQPLKTPDDGYPDALHSPDPRNVQITYKGGSVNNASAVAISAVTGENQNEIIYYKTIEKKAWGDSEGRLLTGFYAYRTIPNPFQKRPAVTNANNSKTYYGFDGWKITSGKNYIVETFENDIIPADQLIHFQNLPAGNDGNGAIVLEAQWVEASFVVVNNNDAINNDVTDRLTAGGTYETRFVVVNGGTHTVNDNVSRSVTVMGCYPDGTGATNARLSTVTGSNNDLKIENINLGTGGNDFTIRAGWFIVGRGCTGNVRRLIGDGNTGTSRRIRIESGLFNFVNPMSGGGASNDNVGRIILGCDYDRATNDGLTSNDQYADNSSHRHLRVINYVSFNGSGAAKNSNTDTSEWIDINIKSGYYGFSADRSLFKTTLNADGQDGMGLGIGGNSDAFKEHYNTYDINNNAITYEFTNWNVVNETDYRWQKLFSFYCGRTRGGNSGGVNRVLVEGGELCSINGGGYKNGGNGTIGYHLRVKGGWIKGAVYGTASASQTTANTRQVFTGGEINGWIAGGCNGTDVRIENGNNYTGDNTGKTYIYIGGNAEVRSHKKDGHYNNAWGLVGNVEGGNVFASGRGNYVGDSDARLTYSGSTDETCLVVADESAIEQNISGGGYIGIAKKSLIYIVGNATIGKNVYGGTMTPKSLSSSWYALNTDIRMYGGNVKGGIYGGHYQGTGNAGKIQQNVNVKIVNGQVGTDADHIGYVHGGGFGSGTSVGGDVDVTIGDASATESLIVYGEVYGGSALGTVNDEASDHTYVTLNAGTIYGSLYGGGLGDVSSLGTGHSNVEANVYGTVTVTVNGGTVNTTAANGSGAVYGCNNINGSPKSMVTVTVNGTDNHVPAVYYQKGETLPDGKKVGDVKMPAVYAIDGVYGGGNKAHYDPSTTGNYPTVTINGCESTSIKDVFGGGNAAAVPFTSVTVNGGYIDRVFAGGNGVSSTPANVGHKNTNEGDNPGNDYGTGTASVNIYGGTINQVFGGSNAHGVIRVSSSIDIDKSKASGSGCDMRIAEVYRGGNEAPGKLASLTIGSTGTLVPGHSTDPEFIGKTLEGIGDLYGGSRKANNTGYTALNITSGIINRVFGGNNIDGNVTGDIAVTINKTGSYDWYVGNVFGGGNLAAYSGTPTVTLTNGTVSHSVYGGGNEAGVGGSLVNINGGGVVDGIYGGCNTSGTVTGNITVNINGGTLGTSSAPLTSGIFGGGFGKDTGTDGNVDVNIGDASHSPTIYGDVYGGSALGNVNSGTEDYTHVTLTAGTIYGDVYGGGLGQLATLAVGTEGSPGYVPAKEAIAALVNGNVKVTQNGVAFGKATTTDDESHTVVTAGRIFGCNNLNGSPKGTVLVLVSATARVGGGSHTKGTYEMAAVYGGGNLAAYDPTNPKATGQYPDGSTRTNKPLQVVIDGCQEVSIEYVYGGGNAAPTPSTDVLILGAFEIGNAFGGGNGKDKYTLDGGATWNANNGADVGYKGSDEYGTGKSELSLLGGTIHHAFGGSNTLGNVRDESIAYLDESDPTCPLNIDEVYGGGNEAPMDGSSQVNLGCISYLKEIYGGAKQANVGGDIVLTITSGRFERVFGGNNLGGTINGSITVNIEETGCHPIVIGELYGCGNQASYTTPDGKDDPTLNVKSFTSIGQIFGGGFGASATVKGNPVVNINVIKGEKNNGDVTDGTYNYDTDATEGHFDTNGNFKEWTVEFHDDTTEPAVVTVPAHSKGEIGAIGNVFGGGNAAKVDGNTEVNIGTEATVKYTSDAVSAEGRTVLGADIRYNIYGGGNQADVTGKTNVTIGPE